jgi:type II secretory pathway pseudopilin PulG
MKYTTHNTTSGFTLLFSILVATMVVAIGATIISIAIRQTILSGTSRESQYAFYAANTVLECAYYWDTVDLEEFEGKFVFPAPDTDDGLIDSNDQSIVTCSGVNIITGAENDNNAWVQNLGNGETTFYLKITNQVSLTDIPSYAYCAEATVKKENDGRVIKTTIEAKGYNTCDITNPRRVERGLIQYYES